MITLLEKETLNFWKRFIVGARVKIDGVVREFPLHESSYIDGKTLKSFVYVETEEGRVTEAYLVDKDGRRIQEMLLNLKKNDDGLMFTFLLSLDIKEETRHG